MKLPKYTAVEICLCVWLLVWSGNHREVLGVHASSFSVSHSRSRIPNPSSAPSHLALSQVFNIHGARCQCHLLNEGQNTSPSLAFLLNLRGGGWNPFGGSTHKKKKAPTLVELMQEETGQLERQLRQYQDRQEHLTTQLSQLQEQSRLSLAQDQSKHELRKELAKNKATIENLEKELFQLQNSLVRMTELKEQLEAILAQSQDTIHALQQQVEESFQENEQLKAHYEEQLQQLRSDLEAQAVEQIKLLAEQHQSELRKLEEMWQARMAETERDAKAKVDAEKKKMRKLVRITAQRDNKALEEFVRLDRERLERIRQQKEKGASIVDKLRPNLLRKQRSTTNNGNKVETIRSPIK